MAYNNVFYSVRRVAMLTLYYLFCSKESPEVPS